MEEEIRQAIISLFERVLPVAARWLVCASVEGNTCTVYLDEEQELKVSGILLGFDKSDINRKPKTDKRVFVVFSDNTKTNGVVLACEEMQGIRMMGDNYGGIGLTEKIAERLERVENALESLRDDFNTHVAGYNTHVHVVTGAVPSAPPTPVAASAILTPSDPSTVALTPKTNQEYISSTKIEHGDGA